MKKTEELEKKVSHLSAEKTTYMEEVECLKNTIVTLQVGSNVYVVILCVLH